MGTLRSRAAWCRCRMVGCRPIGLSSLSGTFTRFLCRDLRDLCIAQVLFLLAGIAHYAVHIVWAMPVRTLTDGYGHLRTGTDTYGRLAQGIVCAMCFQNSGAHGSLASCALSVQFRSVPFSSVFPCSHPVLCIIGGSRGRSPTADLIGAARLPLTPCVPPAIRPRCGGYLPSILMNLGRAVSKSTPYQL